MDTKKLPFNIALLDSSESRIKGLLAVESMDIYSMDGDFHPQGLYSSQIFGKPGQKIRQNRHGYIDMRVSILHPKIFSELSKLKNLYKGILSGTTYAIWDNDLKDFIKSNILDGETGYKFFLDHYSEIVFSETDSIIRELRIKLINKYRDSSLYRYLIVLPAGLRDIEIDNKRVIEEDINRLYRKVIRASNTISVQSNLNSNSALDSVRWSLQKSWNEIYEYIDNILSGKKGFLLSKWGARSIEGGTRNVITALDPMPKVLGGKQSLDFNDSVIGLHQYMKGTVSKTIFDLRNGPIGDFISGLPSNIRVVDKDTLKPKMITPSTFIRKRWGSEEGIEELINGFNNLEVRNNPVIIDGDYAALFYRDEKYCRVFFDIDELPNNLNSENVKPITWTEMFYLSVYKTARKAVGFVTRYPITGTGSIYPSRIFLKTTIKSESLILLDSDWNPINDSITPINIPILNTPFLDSMSVSGSRVPGLVADNNFSIAA